MAKTLRDQLVGAWKLVSYVEKPVDGSAPFYPMGETPKGISTVDADGVALAAIQGLHQMMQQKDREIAQLRRKLQAVEAKLGM